MLTKTEKIEHTNYYHWSLLDSLLVILLLNRTGHCYYMSKTNRSGRTKIQLLALQNESGTSLFHAWNTLQPKQVNFVP